MIKSPNKILRLLVVVGILFSIAQPYVSAASAADEQQIFSNNNIDGVRDDPAAATTFKVDQPWIVTYILTYHYNGGRGQAQGEIGLMHQDGTMYGPWQTSAMPNQGSQTNLYWECRPNIAIKPGVYTVIDSHPASWSWNSKSGGGITIINGRPGAPAVSQTIKTPSATQAPAQTQKAAALDTVSGPAKEWYDKAYKAAVAGEYDEALSCADKAIQIKPDYAYAYAMRGYAYFQKNLYEKAIEEFDMAIKLQPDITNTYINRGSAKYYLGLYDSCIADQNMALKLSPNHSHAYFHRATAYAQKGAYDLAIADYNRALEIAPNDSFAYSKRGDAYYKKGAYDLAINDMKKAVLLDSKNDEFKQKLAKLEGEMAVGQTSAESPVGFQPQSGAKSQAEPVQTSTPFSSSALASSDGARVLTPFTGYAVSEICEKSSSMLSGVPWRTDAPQNDAAVGSSELGQYEALLRHTMQGLRLFYGSLSPEEDKSFNAFWAPFFDHPTTAALEYFKQITPLLDEMVVVLNNLNGMLSNLGAGLEAVLSVAGDPSSSAAGIAAAEYQEVKRERAKLDDLLKQAEELGNPPNPLAAKCRARKRHKRILQKAHPDVLLVWRSIPSGWTVSNGAFLRDGSNVIAGTGERKLVDNPEFSNSDEVYFRFAVDPLPRYEIRAIVEFCLAYNYDYSNPEKLAARFVGRRGERTPGFQGTRECKFQGWRAIRYDVGFPQSTQKEWGYFIEIDPARTLWAGVMCHVEAVYHYGPPEEGPSKEEQIAKRSELEQTVEQFMEKHIRVTYEGLTEEEAMAAGYDQAKKDAAKEEARVADYDQAKKSAAEVLSDTDDAEAIKEAIAQHEALTEQIRRDAARWAADATAEKDSKRHEELEKRSGEMYANAQAEQDIADSLRTGIIVHTRTEWDEHQHKALVDSAKKEIAAFAMENKLLANIPKIGDMVAGAEGVELREQAQQRISDAIKSPDRLEKLSKIYGELQNKVVNQGEQQMATEQARVDMWDNRVAIAENVQFAASTSIMLGALWAPAAIGSLAIGYAGSTGFVEGGVKGATVAVTRSVSSKADVIISAYEGATRIDPDTGQPGGASGAIKGALWSIGTNKAFEILGGRLQKAKADYALAKQGAGGAGFKPVAKAKGEARIKEYDFKTPEQRYTKELSDAKTPSEKGAIEKKYAIQVEREKMSLEMEGAKQKAENDIHQGLDPAKVKENYNNDLSAINEKYKAKETRNQEHQEVMKELGFDAKNDIKPTGSAPKNASSDMDFTPEGSTPYEAYQKGKAYVEAMKERGHSVDDYGDRWVDNTNDSTIWKPGFGADKPGSSSFEAEVIFGTLPHSDKFGTKGGIEWTSSETHTTDDPLGAVLANAGKASGAGLGNSHPKDLHTIGKSAAKAAEAAGIEVEPQLKAQIEALKAHQTPEQAGVLELGANQATKDEQEKAFLAKVEALMGRAYNSAKAKSDQRANELQQQADTAGNPDAAYDIRAKLAGYKAGNNAALTTIAQASPGLGKAMAPTMKAPDLTPGVPVGDKGTFNFGGFAREIFRDRESAATAPPPPADSNDPAFVGLGKQCKEGAKLVSDKLAAAKPGSEEARYLTELKTALELGSTNPAEAVRSVRGLSGMELAVVLAQLGVSVKPDKKPN